MRLASVSLFALKVHMIELLDDLDSIRRNPGQFVGDVSTPDVMFRETVDNAVDELMNNRGSTIKINFNNDTGECEVSDDGQGLPFYPFKDTSGKFPQYDNVSVGRLLCTVQASSDKFRGSADSSYTYSVGLHGIGLKAVAALSDYMEVDAYRDKQHFHLRLENGSSDPVEEKIVPHKGKKPFSTRIKFRPSKQVFDSTEITYNPKILRLLFDYRKDQIKLILNGKRLKPTNFRELFPGNKFFFEKDIKIVYKDDDFEYVIYLNYSKDYHDSQIEGVVNMLGVNRGVHISKFEEALESAFLKITDNPRIAQYFGLGLRASVSVLVKNPSYTSQSKENMAGCKELTSGTYTQQITRALVPLLKGAEAFDDLLQKIQEFRASLDDLKRKDFLELTLVKGSITDSKVSRNLGTGVIECSSPKVKGTELIIVKGSNAMSALMAFRDKKTQALLPLRGKPVNVAAKGDNLEEIFESEGITSLINTIGVGAYEETDVKCLRYERIIVCSDSDYEGYYNSSLLIGTFCAMVPELMKLGKIYWVINPQFVQGHDFIYHEDAEKLDRTKPYKELKGLAGLTTVQAQKIILDKNTRRLKQLTVKNVTEIQDIVKFVAQGDPKKGMMTEVGLVT